ncbi:hypothetical protein JCM1840_005068 [Sporobolomyces johnsonii]
MSRFPYTGFRGYGTSSSMGERSSMAYPLLVTGAVLPGILDFERSMSREARLPPVSLAGTSTTGSSMRNYQSLAHLEPPDDAVFTFGACFGWPSPPPRGTASFTLPAIDHGRGVAFENGEGVVMIFQGSEHVHTQANPLPSPSRPSSTSPPSASPLIVGVEVDLERYKAARATPPDLPEAQQYRGTATFTKIRMIDMQAKRHFTTFSAPELALSTVWTTPLGADVTPLTHFGYKNGISVEYGTLPVGGGAVERLRRPKREWRLLVALETGSGMEFM